MAALWHNRSPGVITWYTS